MRNILLTVCTALLFVGSASGQDLREAWRRAEAERSVAADEAAEARQGIFDDREALTRAIAVLQARRDSLSDTIDSNHDRQNTLTRQRDDLEDVWAERELSVREISGNVRVAARDLESLLRQSLVSAGRPDRLERLAPVMREGYFPDLDDIAVMADLLLEEIALSGRIERRALEYGGRDGRDVIGDVVMLGRFAAVYRDDDGVGFLEWSPDDRRLTAQAGRPPRGLRRALASWLDGKGSRAPIDLSGGAALRQIAHGSSLRDQLEAGGPVVWPILGLALVALVITVERLLKLRRVHGDTDRLMGEVDTLASRGDWSACEALAESHAGKGWPVVRVLRAGLAVRGERRETIESVLQESILRELPRLERGISALAIIGAVAPLLGLLGTVTGMIDTFRVITLFGTSDPRLMSGGISEALVTTELGLAVAIPIMLVHTWLSRRVDKVVGDMEEKAIGLTNVIEKERS